MAFPVKVEGRINVPRKKVFDAIVMPDHLTGYFASQSSSPIKEGERVIWTFDDVGAELVVTVLKVIPNSLIKFTWKANGEETIVNIQLTEIESARTQILITESSFELNESEVQMALQQTQGWTDFVCSLKAYLYSGINLRTGKKSKE